MAGHRRDAASNLGDNSFLDTEGFAPIGKVTSAMPVVERLFSGYGEKPSTPQAQQQIARHGNAYPKKHFPKLGAILTARIT